MGDSETVVSQASAITDFPTVDYDPANYPVNDAAVGINAGATVASSGPADEAYSLPDGSSIGDKSSFGAEAAMHVSSNAGEESASVDDKTNEGYSVSESTYGSFNANGVTENGSVSAEAQLIDGSAVPTEEDRLWSIVRSNGLDFNAWTALIQETEKVAEDNIEKIRRVYDTFLEEFPLCYGYWKKYADHEARLGAIDKVVEVYERAVLAVTYSVDIWLHYCVFAITTYEDPNIIRRLFERGLAYVGTDYLSAPLWDKYIEYEYSQQQWSQLAMIYTRILENPIQLLDRYYNSFKELAAHRPLSEIQTVEDAAAAMVMPTNVDANGEQGGSEGEPHADEQLSPKPLSSGLTEAEELEKYIAIREELYKKAKEYDSKIIDFETAIRRPYFHVRPLDEAQLANWHNYLDFIETVGDFNKVVKLYERCLIACANYPEYWIRYVLCMETSGSMELATNALTRATQVFVKMQPDIHLFAARFKEQTGDLAGARAEYQLVYKELSHTLLEAVIKHANMEYRLGNAETAYTVYEEAINTEQQKNESHLLPVLYLQYSRFLLLVAGNAERAKEILDRALEHVPLSKPLLEAIIHLESIQLSPKRIDYLDLLVEKFITASSDAANMTSSLEREELSSIFLEFMDLFGDAQAIKKADNRHAKLFLHQNTTSMSRKRNAEDYLSSEKAKLMKSSAGAPSAESIMGAYPSSQNQWSAGYGVQPQTWPPAPQSQGQQWNAGYGQQAAYTGYSGYSGYAHPQVPSSVPQTVGYGAYPSTHPAQAIPPQTYAQSTPAFIPGQQQTAGSQASYYGSY